MLFKDQKPPQEERNPYDWPKNYYMEADAGKRLLLLEERVSQGDEGEDNLLRMEIWNRRYESVRRRNSGQKYKDKYLAGLFRLLMLAEESSRSFGKKKVMHETVDVLEQLGISQEEHFTRVLLLEELKHLFLVYAAACMSDRQYSTVMFGLGRMSREKIEQKLADDIYRIIYRLPENMNLQKEFDLLTQAGEMALHHLGLKVKNGS